MIWAYILIYVPILIFVLAFLYETYLSFVRLKYPKRGKEGYLSATWEVTHTLLVFGVVMLLMLFTKSIDQIATAIFVSTFWAAIFLGLRGALYIYIFYVRKVPTINVIDWMFAFTHVAAALLLVVTVLQASWFIFTEQPEANLQFIPVFLPGLFLILGITAIPLMTLYKSK